MAASPGSYGGNTAGPLTLFFVIALHGAAYLLTHSFDKEFNIVYDVDFDYPEARKSVVFIIYPGMFMLFLTGAVCSAWFTDTSAKIILHACLGVTGLYGVWLAFMIVVHHGAHRRARRATERLKKYVDSLMES